MNIKTYLKGIGVGIIVASLVLIIAGNMNKGMSDEDVIKRARELGMVEASAVNQSNENVVTTNGKTEITVEVADTKENSQNASVEEKSTTEDKTALDNSSVDEDAASDDTETKASEDTKPDTDDANADASDSVITDNTTETSAETAKNNASAISGETVTVVIKSGMSSESAALAVKNAGLVDSDTEFNKYLCSEGYDKRLRVGTFDIPKDADFETIAKSLCGIK